MKILKRIGLVLVVIVGLFIIVGLFLPSTYEVKRSLVIAAPAGVVFDQINDLEKVAVWSPWKEGDPTLKTTFGDVTVGKGAKSHWTSDASGSGSMEIVESVPDESLEVALDFGEMGGAQGFWTLEQIDGGVNTTWGFKGDAGWDIPGRYFGLGMDAMVGPYYDKGLTNLKKIAEAVPAPEPVPAPADEVSPSEVPAEPSEG